MNLSLIVAMDLNNGIGRAGKIPWHLPRDLRRFKALTMGKPVIMGRRTHESIGRVLPGRTNIVLTRDPAYRVPANDGCLIVAYSLADAIDIATRLDAAESFIIGGESLYAECLPLVSTAYITLVMGAYNADTFFPADWPLPEDTWTIITEEQHPAEDKTPACAFLRCVHTPR